MESGAQEGFHPRGWPVKVAARGEWKGRAEGIPGSPAGALMLLETENITGARRTRATPVGLRSEAPGPDQTPAAPPSPQRPPIILQVPSKHLGCPWRGHVMLPSPRSQPQQGTQGAPDPPQPVCGFPSLASLCRTPGACRPPRCPPPCEQGQDWPGGGPQPGAHSALLPLASSCPSPGTSGLCAHGSSSHQSDSEPENSSDGPSGDGRF